MTYATERSVSHMAEFIPSPVPILVLGEGSLTKEIASALTFSMSRPRNDEKVKECVNKK